MVALRAAWASAMPRLPADGGGELAGDHGHGEQHDDGDDVVRVVDAEGEVRRGEEEIIGERRSQRREQRRPEAGEHRRAEHGRKVKQIDRRIAPARREREAERASTAATISAASA